MQHIVQHFFFAGTGAHRQPQRAVDGAHPLGQGVVLDHRQHAQRHALAVVQPGGAPPADALDRLDAVSDGMPKVQAFAHTALALVLLDDFFLEFQAAVDDLLEIPAGILALKQRKQLGVADQPGFQRFRHAVGNLPLGQGGQRVKVHQHHLGLPERTYDVFGFAQVDGSLAADGGIHLRKHRRGAVYKVDAAHIAGGAKAAQVAHNAAAHGDQQVGAGHTKVQHRLQNLAVYLQAFAALALRDGADLRIGTLVGYGLGILCRHAGICQHKHLAVGGVGKLVQVFQATRL